MRMFAVADEPDVLTGLRLSGIEGKLATDRKEAEACMNEVEQNQQIAVLLITENCAAMIPETVKRLKLSSLNPLLVVIPGTAGSSRAKDSITSLIREAIGIKI
ncbi:MAG: V-type ATP synthase subunit F [Oscillospiraceae bacterium]|nr:V-type ATP synthase subunit F [Oscillospiraceae bacterium]